MNRFVEIEIASEQHSLLDNEPDWANLGIEPPDGSVGIDDIGFKTIFLNVAHVEYMELISVLENGMELCNVRLSSGKMITAKVSENFKSILK